MTDPVIDEKRLNPLDFPQDHIVLGGLVSPLCTVEGAVRRRKFSIDQGRGVSGATVYYLGDELCAFRVKFWLYSTQDWDHWKAFRPVLDKVPARPRRREPPPAAPAPAPATKSLGDKLLDVSGIGAVIDAFKDTPPPAAAPQRAAEPPPDSKTSGALDIQHPLLTDLGITAVLVRSISQPEQDDTRAGEWTITVELLEYRKPFYALAKPDASQASPAEPEDSADASIGRMLDQVQSLARQ